MKSHALNTSGISPLGGEELNPRSGLVNNVNTALVDPDRGVKICLNYSSWGAFGPPMAPVASERARGAYLFLISDFIHEKNVITN